MDYEKLYKEALERAKIFKQNWEGIEINSDLALKELKEIFPELSESEEDKLRKEVLSIVKSYRECCIEEGNHRFDDCIAWLEKQKQDEPTPKFKIGDIIHKIGEEVIYPITVEKIEDGYYIGNNNKCFVNVKFQDSYKQLVKKEPAAWSEEDSIRLNQAIYVLHTQGYTDVENWLKNLNPQKINVESEQKSLLED